MAIKIKDKMKAVQVRRFGDVDQLHIMEGQIPKPGKDEILVRIEACGLNYADVTQRPGNYPGGPKPPYFPGLEAAGIVEITGAEITDPAVGSRVMIVASGGLQAEYAAVDAKLSIPLPAELSFAEGAAFPIQYLTAYHALTTVARAQADETVLIHAAAGGFGTAAVQIAKLLGLKVIGTASTSDKRKRILSLHADAAVSYDDFITAARKLTGGCGPDIILETVGGDIFRRSLSILPPLGRLVIIGISSQHAATVDTAHLLFRSKAVMGFHLNAILDRSELVTSSVEKMFDWIRQGKLKIQVGHKLPLTEIKQAHKLLQSRASYGKIVLIP